MLIMIIYYLIVILILFAKHSSVLEGLLDWIGRHRNVLLLQGALVCLVGSIGLCIGRNSPRSHQANHPGFIHESLNTDDITKVQAVRQHAS